MKTQQEQIEKMARTMCGYCSTDGRCAVSKNGREPDVCANVDAEHCLYKEYAERLIENGCYGNVSEYKAEIERLRQEVRDTDKMARNSIEQYKNNYDNAFERLKAQEREIERLKAEVKQAKIDVLNELKTHSYFDDYYIDSYVFISDIDELIEEVENDK